MISFCTKFNEAKGYAEFLAKQIEKELQTKVECEQDYFIEIYQENVKGLVTMKYGIPRLHIWKIKTNISYDIPLSKIDTIFNM